MERWWRRVAFVLVLALAAWACRDHRTEDGPSASSENPAPETAPAPRPPARPALRVNDSEIPEPKLSVDGEVTVLELPARLARAIDRDFPGFHVPGEGDIAGPWADDWYAGHVPFLAWGDYNGDGRIDVVTILFSSTQWMLVVFHRTDASDYETVPLIRDAERSVPDPVNGPVTAESVRLTTVPKGEAYTHFIFNEESQDETKEDLKFDTDSFEVFMQDRGMSLYHWRDGEYETVTSAYE